MLYAGSSAVALASFVEFKRPTARLVWPTVAPLHERIMRRWLSRAAQAGQLL